MLKHSVSQSNSHLVHAVDTESEQTLRQNTSNHCLRSGLNRNVALREKMETHNLHQTIEVSL